MQSLLNKKLDEEWKQNNSSQQHQPHNDAEFSFGPFTGYGNGYGRGSISEYFHQNNNGASLKLRYNEMNATLAANYIRLAAMRSWEIRKFYMFAERARRKWQSLLDIVDPDTSRLRDGDRRSQSNRHSPSHKMSKSAGPSPRNMAMPPYNRTMSSRSFALPPVTVNDDASKPRVRSLSTDYEERQLSQKRPASAGGGNKSGTGTKKKILSFLGGSKGSKTKESDKKVYLSPLHQNSGAPRQRKKKGMLKVTEVSWL